MTRYPSSFTAVITVSPAKESDMDEVGKTERGYTLYKKISEDHGGNSGVWLRADFIASKP